MNWSPPSDPDAPQPAKEAGWVEAFRGIAHRDGSDLADVLADVALHRPVVITLTEPAIQAIGERILNMRTLIEQNATVRADGSELVMARVQREAVGALRDSLPPERHGPPPPTRATNFLVQARAAARIEQARRVREARGEPDRENDRNAVEANPLGGDR